ncbi:MAG: hypothetical protein IJS10_01785, partial [Alphaproteobacteria bacterium]|nr:hypothetical protein [Alphaproteobacteria bacterium]
MALFHMGQRGGQFLYILFSQVISSSTAKSGAGEGCYLPIYNANSIVAPLRHMMRFAEKSKPADLNVIWWVMLYFWGPVKTNFPLLST